MGGRTVTEKPDRQGSPAGGLKDRLTTARLTLLFWVTISGWTVIVAGLLLLDFLQIREMYREMAITEARANFNKDQAFRFWAARHGGIYVPVDSRTPPNPFLVHVPEQNVVTGSGKTLTLMNPAYMLRQMMEEYEDLYGVRGHITSLKHFRPETAPDQWEKSALKAFERGRKEALEFTEIAGKPYLRLMRPMTAKKSCLKCHARQGYREGDLRGGVSVSVPMAGYLAARTRMFRSHALGLGLVWLLGMAGIGMAARSLRNRIRARDRAESELEKAYNELEMRVRERTADLKREIDERREAEESLRIERNNLRNIFEAIHDGLYIVNHEFDIEYVNSAMVKDFGPYEGQKCYAYFHNREEVCPWCKIEYVFDGKTVRWEWSSFRDELCFDLMDTPVTLPDGSTGKLTIFRDITARKRAEEALKKSRDKLNRTLEELKSTQAQMLQTEKMASIGQLAAGVAHEINNPVGFVKSNLGTIGEYCNDLTRLLAKYREVEKAIREGRRLPEKGPVNDLLEDIRRLEEEIDLEFVLEDYKKVVDESLEGMERVAKIVSDLKEFSHVDEARLEKADINRGIESTLNIVWNELKYKAEVIKDLGDIPLVECYPQRLNQVFMNILVNAAQAIEDRGEIRIRTRAVDGRVEITISDTGTGIPKENLSKIFDPFFTTKEVGKGTGLGLNVAYNIIKKHNGAIQVESEEGKGTTFTIRIPVDGPENGASPAGRGTGAE